MRHTADPDGQREGYSDRRHAVIRHITELHKKVRDSGQSRLITLSTQWESSSLVAFLNNSKGVPRIYWMSPHGSPGYAGYGVAAVLTASGPHRFRTINQKAKELFRGLTFLSGSPPNIVQPRLFGGFSFTAYSDPLSLWHAFSAAYFIVPRYLLARQQGQSWLTVTHYLRPENEVDEITWLFTDKIEEFRGLQFTRPEMHGPSTIRESMEGSQLELLVDYETWEKNLRQVIDDIQSRNLDKVVLARGLNHKSQQPIDPALALLQLADQYPDCYRFLFEPLSGQAFFGATPEVLAQVRGKHLKSVALAGSISRGGTGEEDRILGERLLTDPKELQEHQLVVRDILENLRPITSTVNAAEKPRLRKLTNIQHLETPIEGIIHDPLGILPVVEQLHPTPAVGGYPKKKALPLIEKYEPFRRGWYAAPVGWIDKNLDGLFTVAIRSALSTGRETRLFSGAGIVADSDPEQEWQETKLKFSPILDALNAQSN